MAFAHTPYDGSTRPFTVGLAPIEPCAWLEPDPHLVAHLARKAELLETAHSVVFRAEDDTEPAQNAILDRIVANLEEHHKATHRVDAGTVEVLGGGPSVRLDQFAALETAARLVQEDLVLMRPGPEGYRIAAACLCFPSSWSLADKFGKSMHAIHTTVPGFNDGRMGAVVGRIFDNLTVGQLVARYNWSIYGDADLHHPEPKQLPSRMVEDLGALASLFVRVERQTLCRLPETGDILFTIKIHHDPLGLMESHPQGRDLAAGLARQLRDLDSRQRGYKGLSRYAEAIADQLDRLSVD